MLNVFMKTKSNHILLPIVTNRIKWDYNCISRELQHSIDVRSVFFNNKVAIVLSFLKIKNIYLYEQYTTNDCNIFQTANYISQVIITTDDYKDIYIWKLEVNK